MRKIKKAIQVYANQGPKAFGKKSAQALRHYSVRAKHRLVGIGREQKELWEEYGFVSNPVFAITQADIELSKKTINTPLPKKIRTANWFVPNFGHLKFGGIFTIFRFIEKLSKEGVKNRIVIYDNPAINVAKLKEQIAENFPALQNYEIIVFDHSNQSVDELPACDLAFCTFWVSAYLLLKFNKTKRKYYFIQDYEPLFYPGGSTSALAESTYRFGFRALVNTPGLLAAVNQRHGMEGISFIPAVDQVLYHPDESKNNKRVRIFFYARPTNPRNAFNLGITIIKDLLLKYGNKIEVITAGADWPESAYGLSGKITNLGLLGSLEEVADLYRSCDIGFVYMLSKHPSYQPFEFMASGMATVTNNNEDNLWMLKNGQNCLLSEPSPAAMAESIGKLIDDPDLRKKIAKNGYNSLGYTWEQQTEMIWNDIKQV
jgi:glycosyltransferase involved in cell wall biosynthesis